LQLPADRPRPPVQSFEGELRSLRLTREQVESVKSLSRREGVTVFMAYLAVFEVLIHRYTGRDDIVLGTPVANRDRAEVESVIGYLANTLVLRTGFDGEPTFREALARIRETSLGAYEHQDLPYERLVEELRPRRDLSYAPLFQILFVQQTARQLNLPLDSLGDVPLAMGRVPTRRGMARFDVELYALESAGGELDLVVEYSSALFDAPRMLRLLEHYRVLLEAVLVDPVLKIAELPLLTVPERHQILTEWHESSPALPTGEDLLHRLFEVQAEKTPDAVALIAGRERWSYRELNQRADRLAERLRVGPEDRVGVHVRRKPELVAALLAVLKAGAAYVPLDPNYPQARIARILEDARPKVVLVEEELAAGLPELRDSRLLVILSEAKDLGGGNPPPPITGDHLAYLIYTSGSTGEPKGVAIRHRNAAAMVRWALTVFPPADLARVLASTSIAFDLSVFELFVPLSCGGAVILAENALDLPALPAASEVTLVNTVPSAMAELLRLNAVPESVRTVNLAGEALPRSLAEQVHASPRASRLLNLYGPSEDTTYSTFSRVEPGTIPTIGRPVAGGWAVVLDRGMQPAPVGMPGELFLGGAGLARGYLGRPAATAERWLPDPFASEPGARLYRTGDLARFRSDGELEFQGRIDHQVKVRGFRVELGEIEAALASHPEVEEAAVIVQGDGADRRLAAFVVGSSARELRRFLRDRLPEALVPSVFAFLPVLPRTANGKVDRAALAKIDLHASGEIEGAHASPRDPLEEVLAGMWSDLLELERVGVHGNFLDLGGHSLLATQLASRIREQLGVELPVRALF
ncbi:MAG TPA: amino acid adenylation domain-containing protein, partial [Thermoanaerobaculia bacterium]|nr:amino acid adenylation domain-containing protein [Thermoanaerobaculia bacterium]